METVDVRIEGTSPLLMHRYSLETGSVKSRKKGIKETQDNPESYLYTDEDGQLVQPSTHLIGALKVAGAKFKIPGQNRQTYKNVMGSGAVLIEPDMIPHEVQDWEVDRRAVVIKRARIVRDRPVLKKWALAFTMEFDEEDVARDTIKELLDYAGRRVGVGDFRPEKGGPFGRFMVTRFE